MCNEEERNTLSLYKGAKTRVIADSELLEEFEVKVGMCCHLFFLQLW